MSYFLIWWQIHRHVHCVVMLGTVHVIPLEWEVIGRSEQEIVRISQKRMRHGPCPRRADIWERHDMIEVLGLRETQNR